MADPESNLASFYLEMYRQQNSSRSDTERNNHVVIGFYTTLTAGLLGFALANAPALGLDWLPDKAPFGIFLFVIGMVVARFVTVSRKWHCYHTETVKAIQRMFENDGLDLKGAALKVCDSWKGWTFMSPRGAEFAMYLLVLLLLLLNGSVVLWSYHDISCGQGWLLWALLACALGTLAVGVSLYGCYLRGSQSKFVCGCPFIPEKERTAAGKSVNCTEERSGES